MLLSNVSFILYVFEYVAYRRVRNFFCPLSDRLLK